MIFCPFLTLKFVGLVSVPKMSVPICVWAMSLSSEQLCYGMRNNDIYGMSYLYC